MRKEPPKRIGFVLNTQADSDEQILFVLTTHKTKADNWDVWKPRCEEDKRKDRSAREYAQFLFVLLSHAAYKLRTSAEKTRYSGQNKQTTQPIKIYREDEKEGCWVKRPFDVIQERNSYKEIPSSVRGSLKPLVRARGKRGKNGLGRIEIATDCLERVFFWNIKSKSLASIDFEGHARGCRPLFFRPPSSASIDLEEVYALSQKIPRPRRLESWQDLYRCSLIEHEYISSPKWLSTTSLEVEDSREQSQDSPEDLKNFMIRKPKLKFKGTPLTLPEIITRHKNVLFTGPAGSGKTTAFRLLTTSWSSEEVPSLQKKLCFYVRLKETEEFLESQLRDDHKVDISELIGLAVCLTLKVNCSRKRLMKCKPVRDLAQGSHSQKTTKVFRFDEILKFLRTEVADWFRETGCHQSNTVVFIDGINELRPFLREALKPDIANLARHQCRVVVSCRSNFANRLFADVHEQFLRFEIQELDDQQITRYLECNVPCHGRRIFESQIKIDHKLLSMAKNPFYLHLIAEVLKRKPNSKIPTHRAKLIESFVLDSIEKKHREGVLPLCPFKDDMIAVVLPRVAKWSLRTLTTEVTTMSVPFHLSKEFQDIQSPSDSLKTLEIAENYGLLRFSGLLEESRERWGYPAFLHDNFRDFFAAMYLLSLGRSISRKLLPKIIEYFAWDQPLLFFLELTNNVQVCKEVTELALSKDPVLGGMCARHAHSLQKELCVKAACEVYKLSKSFFRTNFLSNITRADKVLEMRSSPKYALGRLSVSDLLSIWQDQSDGSEIEHHIFEAIRENVNVGDFEYLKEIWSTLPKTPRGEVYSILTSIARIPTHDAFQFFVEAYKGLFTSPDFELNELTKWLFNYFMVDYIEYSPSLPQAIDVFPPDKYPNELGMLLSKVRKISKKDVRLLEQFVFHDNDNIADNSCKLLTKTSSIAGFPILISRLESINKKLFPIAYDSSQFELYRLRNTLLQKIVHIDPQQSSKFLIVQISNIESQNRSLLHPWTSKVPKFYWPFISALSETRSQEALNLLVEKACQAFDPDLSTYCANLLEGWPERDMVLAAIKDYSQEGKYSRCAKLLRARLKCTKCSVDILKLFDDLFSQTVLKEKSLPISDPSCRFVYYEKQQGKTEYSLAEALHLLLMAVRAVSMTPSPEIIEKVLHILKWQYEHVVGIARKIGNGPMVMSLDLLAESLSTFTSLILRSSSRPILERFLRSDTLGHLLDLITKEWHGSFDECCSNLTRSLVRFCESAPNQYVPELFSILCNKYKQVSNQLFSAEFDIPAERICQIIVTLCRRVDDDLALGFINDIEPPSPQIDQKHLHIVSEFVKAIKLAKGRRFLLDSK